MRTQQRRTRRDASILPLVTLCLVAIFAFVALAVDVGLLLVAKTQCQNAADVAAVTAARAIDGSTNPNYTGSRDKARQAAHFNKVLGKPVVEDRVTIQFGSYHYDQQSEKFKTIPNDDPTDDYYTTSYAPFLYGPLPPNDNYNLARAKVAYSGPSAFARVIGWANLEVAAVSTAAHRPRDFCIVLDFSGSMNNESDLWNNEGYLGSANNSPNSTDPIVPKFGHYSDVSNAKMFTTSTDSRVGKCNITQSVLGMTPLVEDFYKHDRGASLTEKAFAPITVAESNLHWPPSGEQYRSTFGTSGNPPTFAKTIKEVVGSTDTQITNKTDAALTSYYASAASWKGYTQGPGYFGKTFFVWPPDPDYVNANDPTSGYRSHSGYSASSISNPPRDWRKRFFLKASGSYPTYGGVVDDNRFLWSGNGTDGNGGDWRNPLGDATYRYVINYKAILAWIKESPNPFPSQLRSGRITYYTSIPDDVPQSAYDHGQPNSNITNQNQRFWKEYIDYVIGVWRSPFNAIQTPGNPSCSYGPDYSWGTVRISAPVTGYATSPSTRMFARDNPKRPRHRFWFGPLTLVQFISDTGKMPGTAHDISMFPAKLGISAALEDIRNNHPNDLVSMILFNRPTYNDDPAGVGAFAQAQYNLSRDYTGMINSLWYPPNSAVNDIRPWDPEGSQVPRSYGDFTSNTATMHGLLVAYNQYSGAQILRDNQCGGWGRKGAQRIVILETDGMFNVGDNVVGGFANNGPYQSYYRILPGDTVNSAAANRNALLAVAQAITNKDDGQSLYNNQQPPNWPAASWTWPGQQNNYPGYSTPRKPVVIHTLAFGAVMEPTASGTEPDNVRTLLKGISAIGGTRFPDSENDPIDGYKYCIGTLTERKEKLKTAFTRLMNASVTVAIVQ